MSKNYVNPGGQVGPAGGKWIIQEDSSEWE